MWHRPHWKPKVSARRATVWGMPRVWVEGRRRVSAPRLVGGSYDPIGRSETLAFRLPEPEPEPESFEREAWGGFELEVLAALFPDYRPDRGEH